VSIKSHTITVVSHHIERRIRDAPKGFTTTQSRVKMERDESCPSNLDSACMNILFYCRLRSVMQRFLERCRRNSGFKAEPKRRGNWNGHWALIKFTRSKNRSWIESSEDCRVFSEILYKMCFRAMVVDIVWYCWLPNWMTKSLSRCLLSRREVNSDLSS
jgi:hypothetical protein